LGETTVAKEFIHYLEKNGAEYGAIYLPKRVEGKKVNEITNLGLVIDKDRGIFRNRERGVFSFSLEDGYGRAPADAKLPVKAKGKELLILDFGDSFLFYSFLESTPYYAIIESLLPSESDTLFSLLGYHVLGGGANCYAQTWWEGNYVNRLYPLAHLQGQRISEFLTRLGNEAVHRTFFKQYLATLMSGPGIHGILIDSTGLPNSIDLPMTAISNHNGDINLEMRLIFVTERTTGMPLLFRYIAGNVVDVTTLEITVNELYQQGVTTDFVILDAGYYSEGNIIALHEKGIAYVTRLQANRKLYKELILQNIDSLEDGKNLVKYNGRALYVKRVECKVAGGFDAYAYIAIDLTMKSIGMNKAMLVALDDNLGPDEINARMKRLGVFVLVSSENLGAEEILPLYYTRQQVEQVFDIVKNYADMLPLRVHSEETLRGHLMLGFIATIICRLMQKELDKKEINMIGLTRELKNQKCKVYPNCIIPQEPKKKMNDGYKVFKLTSPPIIETEEKSSCGKN